MPFEPPDKRAIFILAPLITLMLLHAIVDGGGWLAFCLEKMLYLGYIFSGAAFLILDLREGYCLNRPSITRADAPGFFWLEQLAACLLVIGGFYHLFISD